VQVCCRQAILTAARGMADLVGRLIALRQATQVSFEDVQRIGKLLQGRIILAFRGDKARYMAKYNVMDSMRSLLALSQYVIGAQGVEYCERMHHWMLVRQARSTGRKFGVYHAFHVQSIADCIQKRLGNSYTVNYGTVYMLICEVRQCVQRYSKRGLSHLVRMYRRRPTLKRVVESKRIALFLAESSNRCQSVQVFESIRVGIGMSLRQVKRVKGSPLSMKDLVIAVGSERLCPKVCWESCPEWNALRFCMSAALARVEASAV
jgi:hypothetical protein